MGFIYSFDMSKEIPHFRRMPEYVQASAERNAVDVIYESFVVPGDQDFLMARLLAQKGLHRGFFWAASQATEKYLKAFLLMNGAGVKKFKFHPIKDLYEAAKEVDSDFTDLDIHPHQRIQVEANSSQDLNMFTVLGFIEELETHGSADNRYNTFGVRYNLGHLFALDSLLFKVRGKIGAPPIGEILKKISPDLLAIFEKYNPWFQINEEISNKEIISSSSVTKFEILTQNQSNPAYNIALQWLRKKMKLPEVVKIA